MVLRLQKNPWLTVVLGAALVFLIFSLFFTLHRYYSFYASFDQGIFNQVFWNGIHGRFFQSSLSSSLSTNVVHDGQVPEVYYHRLGQHFTPALLLWLPLYALFPSPATLTVLLVTLITAGGLVLYALARIYLEPRLAGILTLGYYGANAVLGPTLGNFHDNSQLCLFAFTLLLAMEKRWWGLFWPMAGLMLAIREDGGVTLFGIGVYMVLSRRFPKAGLGVCTLSFVYMMLLTNAIMPLFSEDISRRFMIERFGKYVESEEATTVDILLAFVTRPFTLLQGLFTPIGRKISYLLGQWLPLAFIPAVSPAAWTIAGFPLLQIFLQQGQSATSINLRYALAVVPGLFYGTILWWANRQSCLDTPLLQVLAGGLQTLHSGLNRPIFAPVRGWQKPLARMQDQWKQKSQKFRLSFRRFWIACIALSVLLTLTSNPNRTFYFLIPDSIQPWVYVSLPRQWQHVSAIRPFLKEIPADASVSASTYIVPHLSGRRAIVRFPDLEVRNDNQQVIRMEYIISDLWQLQQYEPAFQSDRQKLKDMVVVIEQITASGEYGILGFQDGVIFMKRGVPSQPDAVTAWQEFRLQIEPILQKQL